MPQAVSEILSTAKGTTFYVLTVAGEHGVPADSQDTARVSGSTVSILYKSNRLPTVSVVSLHTVSRLDLHMSQLFFDN